MKASKKTFAILGGLALVALPGCMIFAPVAAGLHAVTRSVLLSTPGSEPNDSLGSWWDDMASDFDHSWRIIGRDVRKAHRTFDRVFLNHDWEDPYL